GCVYAVRRADGSLLWETHLLEGFFKSGSNFVSLLETPDTLYAFTSGTLFALEKGTGETRWSTEIPHLKHYPGLLTTMGLSSALDAGIGIEVGDDGSNGGGGD
ncbi:MAG: hypothetical protein KJO38_01730, partial [Gammaproteobacteria bacterium]|nr:hypothetical protein [Gammaproteobacteria bacterium]